MKEYSYNQTFTDNEKKKWYGMPPANYSLNAFVDYEIGGDRILPRDRWYMRATNRSQMPVWIPKYIECETKMEAKHLTTPEIPPLVYKRHAVAEHKQREEAERVIEDLRQMIAEKDEKIASLENDNKLLRIEITKKDGEIQFLKAEIAEHDKKIAWLQEKLQAAATEKTLCFSDLKPGGLLNKFVADFTFFQTYEANEEFLCVINWDDDGDRGCKQGDGLCVGLRQYCRIPETERNKGEIDPPEESSTKPSNRLLDWKTEYFIFNVYCHVGMTMCQISPLFGIKSPSLVSDIIYAWGNVLVDALTTMFPKPTCSQLL